MFNISHSSIDFSVSNCIKLNFTLPNNNLQWFNACGIHTHNIHLYNTHTTFSFRNHKLFLDQPETHIDLLPSPKKKQKQNDFDEMSKMPKHVRNIHNMHSIRLCLSDILNSESSSIEPSFRVPGDIVRKKKRSQMKFNEKKNVEWRKSVRKRIDCSKFVEAKPKILGEKGY